MKISQCIIFYEIWVPEIELLPEVTRGSRSYSELQFAEAALSQSNPFHQIYMSKFVENFHSQSLLDGRWCGSADCLSISTSLAFGLKPRCGNLGLSSSSRSPAEHPSNDALQTKLQENLHNFEFETITLILQWNRLSNLSSTASQWGNILSLALSPWNVVLLVQLLFGIFPKNKPESKSYTKLQP